MPGTAIANLCTWEDFPMRIPTARQFGFFGWLALGIGLAASLALFEPRRGAARRARIRDKLSSRRRRIGNGARGLLVDAGHRLRGVVHDARGRLRERRINDVLLEDRVRAQMSRTVSHPGALRIKAVNGCIEISGPILRREVGELVDRIRSVRGVKDVVERLDVQDESGSEPWLQGAGSRQAR
jgi:hypothetical protein